MGQSVLLMINLEESQIELNLMFNSRKRIDILFLYFFTSVHYVTIVVTLCQFNFMKELWSFLWRLCVLVCVIPLGLKYST